MAKAKKQTLTPEERLEQALVPEDEQPYAVPGNWTVSYFTSLIDVQGGTQPPKSTFVDTPKDGYVRLVQIRDFASDRYAVFIPESTKLRYFSDDDILIARYGASLGRICTGMSGAYNVALAKAIFSDDVFDKRFVFWMLQSECFQAPLMQLSRTAQVGFNKEDLSSFPIVLPPLPEQHRIVVRIESLFDKLDRTKALVQSALDSFETRRAAILHKAFTGELTAKWREENGVGLDSWESKRLCEVCVSIYDGDHMPPPKSETGLPFLVISNINNGYISLDTTRFVPETYYENLSPHRTPQSGDVLYSVTGSFGIPALVENDDKFCFQRHIALLRPDPVTLDSRCMWYVLQTYEIYNQADSIATGTAQKTVPIKGLREIFFKFPTLLEQQEIVRILDDLLEKERTAQELASTIEKIDQMKKAILARAFRGELGTNDPSEESAIELLKESLYNV